MNTNRKTNSISHLLLLYANQGVSIKDFLRETLDSLIKVSGCSRIEINLFEKGKNYFCEAVRNKKTAFNFFSGSDIRQQKRKHFNSFLDIPIEIGGDKIGYMILEDSKKNFFSSEDKSFYEDLSGILGIALAHRRVQVDARERVKELVCLYGISKISVKENISIDQTLKEIVELLPPGWLYPEAAEARIEFDGKDYKTKGYKKTKQVQSSDIIIRGDKRGVVELVYVKKMPDNDIGPFLNEEQDLIEAIAKELSFIIERKISLDEKNKLQEQLRHADRLATIGKLAAGIAHELNEPIGNILGFAQLIKRSESVTGQVARDLEKIINASLYSRDIIRQLLIFARMMPSKMTSVALNKTIEVAFSFLEARCKKEGIKVKKNLAKELPDFEADQSQIVQILVNLIVNAIDAMPGGGTLNIKTSHEKGNLILSVEDSGAGMSDDVKKQIYLPFFTTKEVGQGTGLGLSVVHGIVESHRGTISVHSEQGKGSKFTVIFPVKKK